MRVGFATSSIRLPLSGNANYAALLGGMSQVARFRDGALVHVEQMIQELAQLRRGHGVHAEDLPTRLGESLRRACGIDPDENSAAARQKLIDHISAMVEALPPDLRLAVQSAYALPPASQARFLKDRMAWLGERIDRDPRTATRRVQAGLGLLAERMTRTTTDRPFGAGDHAPDGWYVNRLRAVLRLTTDPVQLMEERVIVAARDALAEVPVSWSVPGDLDLPGDTRVDAELIYGGELVRSSGRSTPTTWAGSIRLPRLLNVGERHEYHVRISTVGRRYFRPCYVISPCRRCDEFELRIKFDTAAPPRRVWCLSGVPDLGNDRTVPRGSEVCVDSAGEITLQFPNPRRGLNYGVRWVP